MAQKLVQDHLSFATREAHEDMDNAYRAVKLYSSDAAKIELCDTAGERAFGVIEQSWDDDDYAKVITSGVAIVTAGAAITAGADVAVDASGRAITATYAHEWKLGRCLTTSAAAGDQVSVWLDIQPIDPASLLGYGLKVAKLAVSALSNGAETSTGFTLPTKAAVYDVLLDVVTAEATGGTKTLDVGTLSTASGDADGFIDGASVAAIALVRGQATVTTGSNTKYFSANTRGVLLSDYQAGTDVDQDEGVYIEKPCLTMGGKTITYTAGSADFAELVANIYVIYAEIG